MLTLERIIQKDYNKWKTSEKKVIRKFLRQRDGNRCFYCKIALLDNVKVSIEHLTPRSSGADNSLDNLVLACEPCNNRRGDKELLHEIATYSTFWGSWNDAMTYARLCALVSGHKTKVYRRPGGYFLIRAHAKLS